MIPRGELDLPADIYGEDVFFTDDGYDRSKLNVPGLLHLEVAVKWNRESSSGSQNLLNHAPEQLPEPAAPLPGGIQGDPSSTAAPAARLPEPPSAAPPPPPIINAGEESGAGQHARPAEGVEFEKAMADIVAQTMKALGFGRWVSKISFFTGRCGVLGEGLRE